MIQAINLASMSGSGDWPIAGGLLDQAAWFLQLKRTFDSETGRLENEQIERARKSNGGQR